MLIASHAAATMIMCDGNGGDARDGLLSVSSRGTVGRQRERVGRMRQRAKRVGVGDAKELEFVMRFDARVKSTSNRVRVSATSGE